MVTDTATVTYTVPPHRGSNPELARWGEYDGNALLKAVLDGDGQAITEFLAGFIANHNDAYDAANARYAYIDKVLVTVGALLPTVTLTGFKAHANTDPKTRYRQPKVTNEGEGCLASYCDLAAKFALPAPPEGQDVWNYYTLACQKHAIKALSHLATNLNDERTEKGRYIYLTGDQHKQIESAIRDGLAAIKA